MPDSDNQQVLVDAAESFAKEWTAQAEQKSFLEKLRQQYGFRIPSLPTLKKLVKNPRVILD